MSGSSYDPGETSEIAPATEGSLDDTLDITPLRGSDPGETSEIVPESSRALGDTSEIVPPPSRSLGDTSEIVPPASVDPGATSDVVPPVSLDSLETSGEKTGEFFLPPQRSVFGPLWEHRVVYTDFELVDENRLNAFGAERWELISMAALPNERLQFVFRRPR